MNKIYTMTDSGKPLVSNILATDIRNDLNREDFDKIYNIVKEDIFTFAQFSYSNIEKYAPFPR